MPSNNLTPSTEDWNIADAPDPGLDTSDEKKTARLSKTKAWKQVDAYIADRKKAYTDYLPGINPAIKGTNADWIVADAIVKELTALQQYVDDIAHGVS